MNPDESQARAGPRPRRPSYLVVVLLILLIFPVLIAQAWFYARYAQDTLQSEQDRTLSRARTLAAVVQRDFEAEELVLRSIADRPSLRQAWEKQDLPALDGDLQDARNREPELLFLAISDTAGTILRTLPRDPIVNSNFAYRDWFRGVTATWQPYVSEVYRTSVARQELVVAVAVPIRGANDQPAGILMAAVSLKKIARTIEDTQEGVVGEPYIVDQRGNVVAPVIPNATEPSAAPEQETIRRALAGEEISTRTEKGMRGYVLSAVPIPSLGWAVLYRRPTEVALGSVVALRRDMLKVNAYLLLTFLTCAAIVHFQVRRQRKLHSSLEKSEKRLEQQSRLLSAIIQSMGEGVAVADENGRFVVFNPAGEQILGKGAVDVPPERWAAEYGVFLPDGETPFPAEQLPLARALRGESCDAVECLIRNEGLPQSALLEISGRPVIDALGTPRGGVVVFRDITERKRTLEELARGRSELQARTHQLETANQELEAFTYSVSHDLRAPLRHISGFASILQEDHGDKLPEEARAHFNRITQAAAHMGRLIDDLLNLTRVGRKELTRQSTQLEPVVRAALADVERDAAGREIEWRIGPLPQVNCDPGLTRQVFVNLLSNSVKYSRPREKAVIEIGQMQINGDAALFVRDNGVGFDMKYAHKLFGVFQRLHHLEDFEGTGVGLATVQRIVHKHGGRIWAEAAVDQGATFYFTLGGEGPKKDLPPRHRDTEEDSRFKIQDPK